ncbi:MAG TPA: Asp-tRNA(Asn)/Glu-tRNA(Gln) amidotransferase subunit GatB [Candidatus Polarisedimenticolia bacterium]|nr:Asp-tRNA(Asn)/Glu-tRNA(Gln) amidotransferase subunit GatB [Candidatus Polarisedimenticolia bacterium]
MDWETVIGLEVHCQLRTATKIFCGCPTRFGAPPNTNVCPICLGMPGVLPVLNRRAVDYAVRAGLALSCTIQPTSVFARKNYFYPDLPKGYQISMYDQPLMTGGHLDIETAASGKKRVGLTRIHMEEDAGKLLHEGFADSASKSYVDYNRSGVPLIEIVSEPDMRSPEEAHAYYAALRELLVFIGVTDGNMEEGSLRCDANVSLRPRGQAAFGTKAELKNLNSFKFVQFAIEHEVRRQREILESGGKVVQETRLYDPKQDRTVSMRSKEEAHDYRYFPEPDLPTLRVDAAWIEAVRRDLPELPWARRARFTSELGLKEQDAQVLVAERALADYFEAVAAAAGNPRAAASWVLTEVLRKVKEAKVETDAIPLAAARLGALVKLVDAGTISGAVAKGLFEEIWSSGADPADLVRERGLTQVSDEGALLVAIDAVLAANPTQVASYRGGKTGVLGFLVGQVMKSTGGKANPALVNRLLKDRLDHP